MESSQNLHQSRLLIANSFFQEFNVPTGIEIEDASGFESSTGSNEFYRIVYLAPVEKNECSIKATFSLTFRKNSVIIESATIAGKNIEIPTKYAVDPNPDF